ncbi:MAG: hypothetical protein A4S14_02105 [Proteobacteria bacterium SG_bin9]|nr:MAG: hypothetical protein A4S14_02105 [Proteobacteria bacterium SG_bin9]
MQAAIGRILAQQPRSRRVRDYVIARDPEDSERGERAQQSQQGLRLDLARGRQIIDRMRAVGGELVGDLDIGCDCDQARNLEPADQQIERGVVVRRAFGDRMGTSGFVRFG